MCLAILMSSCSVPWWLSESPFSVSVCFVVRFFSGCFLS